MRRAEVLGIGNRWPKRIGMARRGGNSKLPLERLLTVEEVAELLHVEPSWVYGRTRRRSLDRLPGFRLGKYWRFREADVLAWLEQQRVGN